MEGVIVNYRRGRHRAHTSQMIVSFPGVEKKDKATELVGKKVVWQTPSTKEKRELLGTISATHGNSGAVRVKFETGMPGQSLGQKVHIK